MSFDKSLDAYLERRNLRRIDAVCPESSCQIFDGQIEPDSLSTLAKTRDELEIFLSDNAISEQQDSQ
ncbi:MAG: hypothetical protein SOW59_04200 [Corynebacterium sp.]|nr:hypothetical protein [Corynebacterium sp.]